MNKQQTFLFLCEAGAAKSVMAASLFNELAPTHGIEMRAVAAAAAEPYEAVPPPVVELLERESIDVRDFVPRPVTSEDVDTAAGIVAIGCELSSAGVGPGEVERWDDVPNASEDLDGSATAIRRHVEELIRRLAPR